MNDIFYDQSSIFIAVILLAFMGVALEVGYRIGIHTQSDESAASISQIKTIQSSLLGILALMLGFTFSIALDRYNSRSLAVVDEANAIGTAYLRSDLLSESSRKDVQRILREYVSVRTEASELALSEHSRREALLREAVRIQEAIWNYAVQATRQDPDPVTTGLFVQSVTDFIDSYGRRIAEVNRHVPELVLIMLYGSFIITGGIIGYVAGVSGHRPARATYLMTLLVVMLMFMVIDLDHPRRGIIQVSQQSLIELKTELDRSVREEAQSSATVR